MSRLKEAEIRALKSHSLTDPQPTSVLKHSRISFLMAMKDTL